MPKNDLGQKITKSLALMAALREALDGFSKMPLKKGLMSANVPKDEKLTKMINDALEEATALDIKVEDLMGTVGKLKPAADSRFETVTASLKMTAHNVVAKFLEGLE